MATELLVALRRLGIVAIFVIFVMIAAVLAYANPDPIAVDIGVMRIEGVSLAIVLAITFVVGAIFGAFFSSLAMLKHMRERRSLRRRLGRAEDELGRIRRLPLHDAD